MDISISVGQEQGNHGINVTEDGKLRLEGGKISIEQCYEGLQATDVTVAGGILYVYATDDGLNASSGNPGNPDVAIHIEGGEITIINAGKTDADGFDSNHSVYMLF